MKIVMLDGLTLDNDGNLINDNNDKIHLRQGDMDGACGLYCVAMALLALGKIGRYEISAPDKIDGRTRAGKLLNEIHSRGPLVSNGTNANHLLKMLQVHNLTDGQIISGTARKLIPSIKNAIDNNNPVIIDVRSEKNEGLNHWALAIGHSEHNLFLLDPGYELRQSNFWNATISTNSIDNRFGYRYTNPYQCYWVEIDNAVIIS
jgi:hypothetical protein